MAGLILIKPAMTAARVGIFGAWHKGVRKQPANRSVHGAVGLVPATALRHPTRSPSGGRRPVRTGTGPRNTLSASGNSFCNTRSHAGPEAPDPNRNGKESTAHVTNNAVTQPAILQDATNAVIPRLTFRFRWETKRVR